MAQNSSIEWTTDTWNPLAGCTRASAGCDNCYAAKMSLRLEAMALADIEAGRDPGGKRKYIGIATKNGRGVPVFNGTINLDWEEFRRPFRWKKPRLVFVNSMSDLFHKDVPDGFIIEAVKVMRDNPQHTFQVLTKRPDRMADFSHRYGNGADLPPNIWAGTSVEDQKAADERIPDLLRVRAAVRFLSCEPLLAPVDLERWLPIEWSDVGGCYVPSHPYDPDAKSGINWVIVGGESGSKSRPLHMEWVYDIKQQCESAGVPVFIKQMGDNPYYAGDRVDWLGKKGGDISKWPAELQVREFPTD